MDDKDKGITPLMDAARTGDAQSVKLLLAKGADVNAQDNDGYTALMYVSVNGHLDIVQSLLTHGADVNIRSKDGDFALLHSVHSGNAEATKLLIEKGADVNAHKSGQSALTMAITYDYTDVVKLLLAAGASLESKDNSHGMSTLEYAKVVQPESHFDTLKLLERAAQGKRPTLAEVGLSVNAVNADMPQKETVGMKISQLWNKWLGTTPSIDTPKPDLHHTKSTDDILSHPEIARQQADQLIAAGAITPLAQETQQKPPAHTDSLAARKQAITFSR